MTEERVPAQVTREEAQHYILLTLDRFRVMTLHLADNKSRLPSALNGNEGGLDLLYELEARDFYRNLMFLYTSDIFEVLSNEGLRELLLKCKELSDRFCLKVRIAEDIRVVEDPPGGELSLSQTEDADKESLWDSFLGALQGEFNEEPSIRSIFIDMGLNLVPIVGQAMDARDIIACLDKLVRQKRHQEIMVWVTLVLTAIGCVPGAGDVIKSIGKAIIKGADDITITLLKKLDAEDILTAFVKFCQTLQASTEEAVATINGWLKKAENRYKETELAKLLSTTNECMNKAVEFVQAKVDEFGRRVFGREDIFEETARIKINKVVEVKFNSKNFEDNPADKAEYIRQLKNQEEALNNLTIQEYLDNIENYKINGRGSESAKVQKQIRKDALNSKIEELRNSGMSYSEAKKQAEKWLSTQAVLHNPDMIAGGNPFSVTGVGEARINSSIGSQWGNGKAKFLEMQIRESIKSIDSKAYTTTFLNVKLTTE